MTNEEINEAVARKLGWRLEYNDLRKENMYTRGENNDWRMPWMIEWKGQGPYYGDGLNGLPRYVYDIQAAWEIVEHLMAEDFEVRLDADNTGSAFWATKRHSDKYPTRLQANADTATLAICKAFLTLP